MLTLALTLALALALALALVAKLTLTLTNCSAPLTAPPPSRVTYLCELHWQGWPPAHSAEVCREPKVTREERG